MLQNRTRKESKATADGKIDDFSKIILMYLFWYLYEKRQDQAVRSHF